MPNSIETVRLIIQNRAACEDDLIAKVVLPFFAILGYDSTLYRLKVPIECYRPNRAGRKPEADCVFYGTEEHNEDNALIVAEVKYDEQPPPELQARFYSANLFVPFYVAWEGLDFQIYQLHAFRKPREIGRYSLSTLSQGDISTLRMTLNPVAVTDFCKRNEIKLLDIGDEIKRLEATYSSQLKKDIELPPILRQVPGQFKMVLTGGPAPALSSL